MYFYGNKLGKKGLFLGVFWPIFGLFWGDLLPLFTNKFDEVIRINAFLWSQMGKKGLFWG